MKKASLIAILLAAAALVACGGGGGGGGDDSASDPGTEAPVDPTPAPAPDPEPLPMVQKVTAPTYSAADCPRFVDTKQAEAALDLANPSIKTVNDFLLEVDAKHAYTVFVRRPYDFVNWIVLDDGGELTMSAVRTATHETQHQADLFMYDCGTPGHKILLNGRILDTRITYNSTPHIKTVADAIPSALPKDKHFEIYISGTEDTGNDLRILLDEFAAYVGTARIDRLMIDAGRHEYEPELGGTASGLEGTVHFMVYLQAYLKALRASDAVTFQDLKANAAAIAAIQTIWSTAESELQAGYKYTGDDSPFRLMLNAQFLDAAYSLDGLAQLDALGIEHAPRRTWSTTYLR